MPAWAGRERAEAVERRSPKRVARGVVRSFMVGMAMEMGLIPRYGLIEVVRRSEEGVCGLKEKRRDE